MSAQRMFVASVDTDFIDVSIRGLDDPVLIAGSTTVDLAGGPYRLTVNMWSGEAPRVGDQFDVTIEAVT